MILRPFQAIDAPRLVECLNNPNVTQFLTERIATPYTTKDANWWINEGSKQAFIHAIEINGELAGCVSAEAGEFEYAHTAEIGYWLDEKYWHKGHATTALTQLLKTVSDSGRFIRLNATVYKGNVASTKVLEKCGFKLEGTRQKGAYKNGQTINTLLYGKLI